MYHVTEHERDNRYRERVVLVSDVESTVGYFSSGKSGTIAHWTQDRQYADVVLDGTPTPIRIHRHKFRPLFEARV